MQTHVTNIASPFTTDSYSVGSLRVLRLVGQSKTVNGSIKKIILQYILSKELLRKVL